MNISFRKILSGLVLITAFFVAVFRTLPPRALPATSPANEFSAERAIGTVRAITGSPRLVGSPAYENAKVYLLAQLTNLGLETGVQNTIQDGVSVENILGRLEGSTSSDAILLSAHLDSVSNSPGATDDGSGVAAIMETVRALRAATPLRNTIIILFTGPEENCCYGAGAFVAQHPWARDVRLVVNLDAGGLSGPSILAATGPNAGWLIGQAARILPDPIGSSAIEALASPATDYTLLFQKAGWTGFDFNLSWSKRIHSPLDNVDNLSSASLQHQGEHMLAVVRHFGNLSLVIPEIPRPIYFDILGLTIVHYPVSWVIYILLGVTLIFAGIIFMGFRKKILTLRGIGWGLLAYVLSLLTVPILLGIIQLAVIQPTLSANPQLGITLEGDSLLPNVIRWGSAILAPVTTILWYGLFRKKKNVGRHDFAFAAYLFLYITACALTFAFPELSYLIVWPLLFRLMAAIPWFPSRKGTTDEPGLLQFLAGLGAGVAAVVILVPGILIALFSIDIRMIYIVPVFVVALLGFLVPAIEIYFAKKTNNG